MALLQYITDHRAYTFATREYAAGGSPVRYLPPWDRRRRRSESASGRKSTWLIPVVLMAIVVFYWAAPRLLDLVGSFLT